MINLPFKSILRKTFIYNVHVFFRDKKRQRHQLSEDEKVLLEWEENGRSVPPPSAYKRSIIKMFAEKHKIQTLVETGTYLGDTIEFFRPTLKKIISIELSIDLYHRAKKRFFNYKKVVLYQGDSGIILKSIVPALKEKTIFWLDGHYSEGFTAKGNLNTPILAELTHILENFHFDHIILVDDARCFLGLDDYPTLQELEKFVKEKNPSLTFEVESDIIRMTMQ